MFRYPGFSGNIIDLLEKPDLNLTFLILRSLFNCAPSTEDKICFLKRRVMLVGERKEQDDL